MTPDMILFPRAGLSYGDVVQFAGLRMADAATKLGVSYAHLAEVAKTHGFTSIFAGRNRYRFAAADVIFPGLGITRDDIESCHGMLKKDAAAILGVSECAFVTTIKKHPDLHAMFPARGGEAWWLARRGYANL